MISLIRKAYSLVKKKYINPRKFNHLKVHNRCNSKWYGNDYGGFFINPDLIEENTIVYSFGIGEDISFDKELIASHNCQVYGFDPTPKSIKWCENQDLPKNFHFYDFGISKETGQVTFHLPKNTNHVSGSIIPHKNVSPQRLVEVEMKSLKDILKEFGHKKIGVLKMDIEGMEYEIIDSILETGVQIDQLAIEFHERFFENGKEKSKRVLDKLNEFGFEIFAISDSYEEVSFVKKDAV